MEYVNLPRLFKTLKTANSAAISEPRVLRPSRFRPQAAIESRFFGRIRWLFNTLHMVYALTEVPFILTALWVNVRTFKPPTLPRDCRFYNEVIGSAFLTENGRAKWLRI